MHLATSQKHEYFIKMLTNKVSIINHKPKTFYVIEVTLITNEADSVVYLIEKQFSDFKGLHRSLHDTF